MANSFHKAKQEFLEYLEIEKGRSAKTVENYDHYLERFAESLARQCAKEAENLVVADIAEKTIRTFRVELNRKEPPLSSATQNYHVIALRMFLKYLSRHDLTDVSVDRIELAKHSRRN